MFDQISLSLRIPWDLWIATDPTVVLGDTDKLVKTHQEKNRLLLLFNLTVATTLVVPSIRHHMVQTMFDGCFLFHLVSVDMVLTQLRSDLKTGGLSV